MAEERYIKFESLDEMINYFLDGLDKEDENEDEK